MTILPEPIRFKPQEYDRFLRNYPHVEGALAEPFVSDEGEDIPLIKKAGNEVLIYVSLISDAQKKALGYAALRELHKHHAYTENKKKFALLKTSAVILLILIIWGTIWKTGIGGQAIQMIEDLLTSTPTPTPTTASTAPPIPTTRPIKPAPSATPTRPPAILPTAAPTRRPTIPPTVTPTRPPAILPTATPTRRPTIPPTVTPTRPPAILPTAAPTRRPTIPPTVTPTPFARIIQVVFKDAGGNFIPEVGGKFSVKPLENVNVDVELEKRPENVQVTIDYRPAYGEIVSSSTYIAPDKPGGRDLITIKVFNKTTNEMLTQTAAKIKIIDVQ